MSTQLTDRFANAVALAIDVHNQDADKFSRTGLFNHCLASSAIVLEYQGSEDEAIAAMLHHSLVGLGGTLVPTDIMSRFGLNVLSLVECCGDDEVATRDTRKKWLKRKHSYIGRVSSLSQSHLLVIAATTLDILRTLSGNVDDVGPEFWKISDILRDDFMNYFIKLTVAMDKRESRLARDSRSENVASPVLLLLNRVKSEVDYLAYGSIMANIMPVDVIDPSLFGYIEQPPQIH